MAAADGRVASAGPSAGYGNLILIEHTVAGQRMDTGYAHMTAASIMVKAGDRVTAGQQIASVGATGYATGPHLHFELRPVSASGAPVDPAPWLAAQGAVDLAKGSPSKTGGCGPEGGATPYDGTNPNGMVDDPTTDGKITERTAAVLAQVRQQFSSTSWSCYSPRPGQPSEHSLGRACDGTFGNSIGTKATGLRPRPGLEGHQLDEDQRERTRRRIPHLAREDLVRRPIRRRLAYLRRRRHARPRRDHRRALRPPALHRRK
nr:M23 family metallopeptidase [Nocardioides alcanivorans]